MGNININADGIINETEELNYISTLLHISKENLIESISYRFRCQLAENSKIISSHFVFPEQNHNEIEAFQNYKQSVTAQYADYERREKEAFEQYKKEIEEKWEEFKSPEPKIFVEYSEDLNSRQSVDFENQRRNTDMTLGKKNTEEALHKEWGYDYDNKVRAAQRAMSVYADEELIQLLDTEAGNHPSVVKLFARLGEDITEEMAKNTQNNKLAVSPVDAKADIAKIYADANHAYHKAGHPDHLNAVEQVRQLHEKVYGN